MDILKFLKCLADETRFKLLKLLLDNKLCVCELTEILDRTQPCISQHVKKLKDLDLIIEEKDKQWSYYTLDKEKYYSYVNILDKLEDIDLKQLNFSDLSKKLTETKEKDLCNINPQER